MGQAPKVLFIHNNFPAQFGALGLWLAQRGWEVTFATAAKVAAPPGLRILQYAAHREPAAAVHPYAQPMERAALQAQAFVRAALQARQAGLSPDLIVSHAGWGPGLCARDVFPAAAFATYCEWWYRYPGADVAYLERIEGEAPPRRAIEAPMLERMRNAPIALEIAGSDAVLCPTRFQADQFPETLRQALTVQHDGIDVDFYAPKPPMRRETLNGLVAEDAQVVTYATRGMEPHRGFPQFMAALPAILAASPRAVAVIAGENRVAYGGDRLRRTDWKAEALSTYDLDPARVRFVGRLERADYVRLLQRSDAHVYLTVPFVLSWSMLEAMATGCALVLSDTDPVREFADEACARLVDMARPKTIAAAVTATLGDATQNADRRAEARSRIVAQIPQSDCFARKEALFRSLIAARPCADGT